MSAKRSPTTVETLPSGIKVEFWDKFGIEDQLPQERRYKVNGEKFVNVTTVLNVLAKDALLNWVERLTLEGKRWREVRDEAGKRGTDSHHLLLQLLTDAGKATLADLPDDHRPWGRAAFLWVHDRSPEIIECERMVASCEHEYAGRLDLLADIDSIRTLTDFKTLTKWSYVRGKAGNETDKKYPPYDENLLQLDLYQGALIECGFEPAERGLIVRLGPDAEYDETFVDLNPERGIAILEAYRAKGEATKALREAVKAHA
jgi:hypothetical protein